MLQMLARLCATLCVAAGLVVVPSAAGATSYTLFDLGMLGAPGDWHRMTATGLNSSGQVVGYASYFSQDSQGEWIEKTQAWVTGANGIGLSTLPTLGGAWNRANGINDAGWVVGSSLTATGSEHAFVSAPGGAPARDLGTLGGNSSSAAGINASGQVVGTSMTAAGVQRGFISDAQAGNLHDLGSLYAGASATSSATAINASGQVTGTSIAAYPLDGTERAFVTGPNGTAMRPVIVPTANGDVPNWGAGINASGQTVGVTSAFYYYQTGYIAEADGSGRLLQLPEIPQGGTEPPYFFLDSRATALNSAGQVVGYYRLGTLADGLFITGPGGSGGNYLGPEDFVGGSLPVLFYEAPAINDAGQFIANAGNGHAYLISPVPEPAVAAMLLAGLGLLAWRQKQSPRKENP
jgi:probable HAF family extracellular repeat protein